MLLECSRCQYVILSIVKYRTRPKNIFNHLQNENDAFDADSMFPIDLISHNSQRCTINWGVGGWGGGGRGGGARLGEGRTGNPKDRGSNPVKSRRKKWRICPSQKCCVDSLSACPTPWCIRTHTNDHARTIQIL